MRFKKIAMITLAGTLVMSAAGCQQIIADICGTPEPYWDSQDQQFYDDCKTQVTLVGILAGIALAIIGGVAINEATDDDDHHARFARTGGGGGGGGAPAPHAD